jgi:hypothetical protein
MKTITTEIKNNSKKYSHLKGKNLDIDDSNV